MLKTSVIVSMLLLFASYASAAIIGPTQLNIDGAGVKNNNPYGVFSGSVKYSYDDVLEVGTLVVTLDNTTDDDLGGYITGFVFNIDGDATATFNPDPQFNFEGVTNESASPFGTFDAGAALGGNFTGGGNPTIGIAVDDPARDFVFDITGADAATLTAGSFLTETSSGNDNNTAFFVVRFKGFDDGGSDKVASNPPSDPSSGQTIPVPAAFVPGIVMLAIIGTRRKRRHA